METEVLKEQHYVEELVDIIRSGLPKEELIDRLSDYHDNDIADALTKLTPDERRELYPLIGVERVAEIFAYLDDAEPYLKELPIESAAKIVSEMDSDDAVVSWKRWMRRRSIRSSACWIRKPARM